MIKVKVYVRRTHFLEFLLVFIFMIRAGIIFAKKKEIFRMECTYDISECLYPGKKNSEGNDEW